MTDSEAAGILESLAKGEDPQGVNPFSPHEVLSRRDVIGALFLGANALEQRASGGAVKRRDLPVGAGKPWDTEEEKILVDEFHSGKSIADMSADHARTDGGIRARLVKLGLIPERGIDPRNRNDQSV
jgi:hypothetical protein